MEDNTKYPWTKSIFGKNSKKIECVYAGPEQMPRFDEESVPVTKPVYAAPGTGKIRKRNNNTSAPMEGVYAGPDAFNEVYAGPEYFERPADALDEAPEELPVQEDMPVQPPQQPFMATYAGPQYFNNTGGFGMFYAPGGLVCKKCGAILKPEYKFCTECGTPVEKNEEQNC